MQPVCRLGVHARTGLKFESSEVHTNLYCDVHHFLSCCCPASPHRTDRSVSIYLAYTLCHLSMYIQYSRYIQVG